jgi:hypothetical protein
MRKRLSWDESKVAEIEKTADPYSMNQDHTNNPIEKYKNWDTETGGEAVDDKEPWKNEGRLETGHPSPARQAVVAARKLEDKAIKCITVAQRMLPGASDEEIECQATDFMFMPEKSIMATLQRQASLAEKLAGDDGDDEKDDEKPVVDDKEPVEAAKNKKTVEAPVVDDKEPVVDDKEPVEAAKEKTVEAPEALVVDDKKPEEKEASGDMLDIIFDNAEMKTGAKKLSGIVKQASEVNGNLSSLWDAPPDVSKAFN